MTTTIQSWKCFEKGQPFKRDDRAVPTLAESEVLVRIAGCGVCHTDLSFFYEGIPTVKPLPITLGHEISGIVTATGSQAEAWQDKAVIVPAVLPCGECDLCKKGRGTICRRQKMPGNHIDGGFASHIVVPSRYLCAVDVEDEDTPFASSGVSLKQLSVVADAVTTPYQAIKNAAVQSGDLAIFIGVGGIGGFGVQIASALEAAVVAIDLNDSRLGLLAQHGADLTINPQDTPGKELRNTIREFARDQALPDYEWKIFETSGTRSGQELAFGLLTFGATLSIVGFTMDRLDLRLSNLMAYDARAIGNWGCHPEFYPEVLEMVAERKVHLAPFVEMQPLSAINDVFERVHQRQMSKRPVLIPDFE